MRTRTLALLALGFVAIMAAITPGVQARQAAPSDKYAVKVTDSVVRTGGAVVGASIDHPARWSLERERQTFDDTYGFTLWGPESKPAAYDHGGTSAVRVARAYGMRPSGIGAAVREKLIAYPDLPIETSRVSVGGHRSVAFGPIPGSIPSTAVYVPVGERVYLINVYAPGPGEEGLDAADRKLLSKLHFYRSSCSVGSLGLPDGEDAAAYYERGRVKEEEAAHRAATKGQSGSGTMLGMASTSGGVPVYPETRIYEGCFLARSTFFFQTQHGAGTNGRSGDGIRTGYSTVGQPNYWGEYTHGNLGPGYGRCDEPYNTNDKFAVDYPLTLGDVVYSPFRSGTVTFAGQNTTHQDYGVFVSIKADNGKYVNVSAHLSGLASGIEPGATLDRNTIIGFAGETGGPNISVSQVHLHQAFYRYPDYNPDGSPFGGRGLQAVYFHYIRGEDGIYELDWSHTDTQISKGDNVSY